MPSRGNGWQTPFSTRGRGRTLDVRWALDYPIHRPDRGKPKRLRVSSDRKFWTAVPLPRAELAEAAVNEAKAEAAAAEAGLEKPLDQDARR